MSFASTSCVVIVLLAARLQYHNVLLTQVVVAKEAVGNLGGMVRQLSLDQFENESRRMIPLNNELSYPTKKFTRQRSPQGLHKKASVTNFISFLYCYTG